MSQQIFSAKDRAVFEKFHRRMSQRIADFENHLKTRAFEVWTNYSQQMKKVAAELEHRNQVINVLKNSNRGQRSTMEKEILRRYVTQHMTCIPKGISFSEMDTLCNEVDWYPVIGRSIVFLQGDFGNVYYMIAAGSVGLYLEPSKDREMIIAREYGNFRGQPYPGTDEDLKGLGINILNLSKGAGFGEYAILATTNKIRSCAVVSRDADSFLMIMHADTYNSVLRQHHYRQKQLSSATALLSELPLFKHLNYSKIASIAYTMKSQTYSSGSTIVKAGQVINNVMLIVSGEIKVFASAADAAALDNSLKQKKFSGIRPPEESTSSAQQVIPASKSLLATYETSVNKMIAKRIPRLAVSILGRGQIIGEMEVHRGQRTFEMTYESCAAGTEVLEIPATVFKENITSFDFKRSANYRNIEMMNQEKEDRKNGRMHRAYTAMRKMMEGPSKEEKVKEQLLTVLPQILDPTMSEPGYLGAPNLAAYSVRSGVAQTTTKAPQHPQTTFTGGGTSVSLHTSPRVMKMLQSTSGGEDAPKVHRRFPGETATTSIMAPPSSVGKKSTVMQSPRKINFTQQASYV